MINKHGSTLQPQLHKIKIKIIIQVQSPQPVFIVPQPQSFPPKNLLNIVPPKVLNMYYKSFYLWRLNSLLYTTYYVENKKKLQVFKFSVNFIILLIVEI